jgi:hypothetical protein
MRCTTLNDASTPWDKTGGHVHHIHGARALLAAVPTPRCFLGNKAHDMTAITYEHFWLNKRRKP